MVDARLARSIAALGCLTPASAPPGRTVNQDILVNGVTRSFLLHVPLSYIPTFPVPLIVSHHGWTSNASQDETSSGLSIQSEKHGFIVAYLNGYNDNTHPPTLLGDGGWESWNGGGTVNSTENKKGCTWWSGNSNYCYESCKNRRSKLWTGCDKSGCDWTTCFDSTSFNTAVLDLLEDQYCIDTTREYATGQSNGAIYTFQIGASLSTRLAAIAPISGGFMQGYIQTPSSPLPVLSVTGTEDIIVPANWTIFGGGATSVEGWIYSGISPVFKEWEIANQCEMQDPIHYPTTLDGFQDLYCWGKLCKQKKSCPFAKEVEYPVVRCAWTGGHNYFGNSGRANGHLVWEFLSKFSNPNHLGKGKTLSKTECVHTNLTSEPNMFTAIMAHKFNLTEPIKDMTTVEVERESEKKKVVQQKDAEKIFQQERNFKGYRLNATGGNSSVECPGFHYGNPFFGCLADEEVFTFRIDHFNVGRICAPKRRKGKVGGYRTPNNGCPPPCETFLSRRLFTTCLAAGTNSQERQDYICLLTCDRAMPSTSVDFFADTACPLGLRMSAFVCSKYFTRALG
ncbi:hypothetical protein AAMO2058_000297300 [Amorphochlora amoebiformis]